jgi:hypothetical protein
MTRSATFFLKDGHCMGSNLCDVCFYFFASRTDDNAKKVVFRDCVK